jgi:hypothetical protein
MMKNEQMRKKGESHIELAGKTWVPLDENNDFTIWCRKSNVSAIATPSALTFPSDGAPARYVLVYDGPSGVGVDC